jgi:DNA-binding protein HU-beta
VNKTELVAEVAKSADLTKKDAAAALDAVLASIEKALKKGDKVTLVGFGTFEVRKRKARKGINPRTREEIKIKATKSVAFKAGATLKDSVSGVKK